MTEVEAGDLLRELVMDSVHRGMGFYGMHEALRHLGVDCNATKITAGIFESLASEAVEEIMQDDDPDAPLVVLRRLLVATAMEEAGEP